MTGMRCDRDGPGAFDESNSEDRVAATAYRPPGVPVDEHNFQDIIGGAVYDFDGDVIGEAWQVYLDDASTRPQWLTVRTSLSGHRSTSSRSPAPSGPMTASG